ncbi:MAG: DUF371 domain-containing protein [Methanocalculus sp. MSAO_Arc1]|uniref:DUF371 domain-containing protein n=1 Tax=Methanocalculus TaxID=71151 RepID=UPI000FF5204B|nr:MULTISPECIES: DUF371 domain-containing protein [unclassified Methanocalculus]MCP1662070.1 hypothetical protein [Methanocalculus sp. AMF5]RQD80132.1 MAG: DUF371 domain-containing protein [Methanocalculus sp. MSAO_Arc1]
MEIREHIHCQGHANVTGRHPTTFEITRDDELTLQGDCIIGVSADKAALDLPDAFCDLLADDHAVLRTLLKAGGVVCEIRSSGSAAMALDHETDLVWRRSGYVCGRTIGIRSDHVARTLPRELIAALARGSAMEVTLIAERPD